MSSERLNVIALISGGKDSFFSVLHCLHHGHRVVALANLFPGTSTSVSGSDHENSNNNNNDFQFVDPDVRAHGQGLGIASDDSSDRDLNSFMYQTVGHEVIPLYAAATRLPLYRQAISRGGAVRHERDYDYEEGEVEVDETESMLSLLQAIKSRHPEANALCAGAILSTYQRTRVESVARRLDLVPLAFLWQYPVLPSSPSPSSSTGDEETQLLRDMANAKLDARIVKVASAGLDEGHLWERVSSDVGARRVRSALRKFGSGVGGGAAALGEGGEFETIVVDGPGALFKKRICVPEQGRKVVREGGGSSWLMLRGADLEDKAEAEDDLLVRTPDMLDPKFRPIMEALPSVSFADEAYARLVASELERKSSLLHQLTVTSSDDAEVLRWSVWADPAQGTRSIREETSQIVDKVRLLLRESSTCASQVTNTVVILRHMSDFPEINAEYGKLFTRANPPSRVTISCGHLLPDGNNIAVYLTIPSPRVNAERNGLHVQSRSYWAPANIGPYSQAIDTMITAQHQATGVRSVTIAGQIPLIPATMVLPSPSSESNELQIVLSLQHLWRVASEMKVQYWTSAVAYFARSTSNTAMQHNARLAGHVWHQIHGSPEDENDDDEEANGPDVWDLKYNSEYMSLGGDAQQKPLPLPDWSVLTLRQQNEPSTCVPPLFSAEVEELPRQAAVEWHAHVGLSRVDEGRLEMISHTGLERPGWRAWHSVVKGQNAALVYSTLALDLEHVAAGTKYEDVEQAMSAVYEGSLGRLQSSGLAEAARRQPDLIYVDALSLKAPWEHMKQSALNPAVIPCRSIWSAAGERLAVVVLYTSSFHT